MRTMPERLTVGRLMIVVALLAVVLAAWMYHRDHADVERAMITADLHSLTSDNGAERLRAVENLSRGVTRDHARIAATLAALVLGDPDPAIRQVAVRSLGQVLIAWDSSQRQPSAPSGSTAGSVPSFGTADIEATAVRSLIRALSDPDAGVQFVALRGFRHLQLNLAANLEVEYGQAVDRLLARPDLSPGIRSEAVWALACLRSPTVAGHDRVRAVLEHDPDPEVRQSAIRSLVHAWPASGLYPILLARRQSSDPDERSEAEAALWQLPAPPPEVVPALIRLLKTDPHLAPTMAQALGKLGRTGIPYLVELQPLAATEFREAATSHRNRLNAVGAIVGIDPDSVEAQAMLAPLWQLAQVHPDNDETPADHVLNLYAASAAALVPTYRAALASPDRGLRHKAARRLIPVGAPAVVAIPDLEAAHAREPDQDFEWALNRLRPFATPGP